jgi:hypothetical protein
MELDRFIAQKGAYASLNCRFRQILMGVRDVLEHFPTSKPVFAAIAINIGQRLLLDVSKASVGKFIERATRTQSWFLPDHEHKTPGLPKTL